MFHSFYELFKRKICIWFDFHRLYIELIADNSFDICGIKLYNKNGGKMNGKNEYDGKNKGSWNVVKLIVALSWIYAYGASS